MPVRTCPTNLTERMRVCSGTHNTQSARKIADVLDKIPHKVYVEPFLGKGTVYRARRTHSDHEALNDIDPQQVKVAIKRTCGTKAKEKCNTLKKANLTVGKDYKEIARKYDSPDTLHYLDPPYHNRKQGAYKHEDLDFDEFVDFAKNLKGKVAISYSDTPESRKALCGTFKCHKVKKQILGHEHTELLALKDLKDIDPSKL